jgi:hypothetical protein
VALLALDVSMAALCVLRDTTAALELQEAGIADAVKKKDTVEPVPPEQPKLLPAVHVLWQPLMVTLQVLCPAVSPWFFA